MYWQGNEDYTGSESREMLVPVDIDFGRAMILWRWRGAPRSQNTLWDVTVKLGTDAYRDFKIRVFPMNSYGS
ncbi:MAG: hypothetical protein R2941_23545 [Desulfobacterales bacterium]